MNKSNILGGSLMGLIGLVAIALTLAPIIAIVYFGDRILTAVGM